MVRKTKVFDYYRQDEEPCFECKCGWSGFTPEWDGDPDGAHAYCPDCGSGDLEVEVVPV